jgi:hypothetical protein
MPSKRKKKSASDRVVKSSQRAPAKVKKGASRPRTMKTSSAPAPSSQAAADFVTFRDPKLSVWQSVVDEVAAQQVANAAVPKAATRRMASAPPQVNHESIRALPAAKAATAAVSQIDAARELHSGNPKGLRAAAPGFVDQQVICSKLGLELAWARLTHNTHEVERLSNELQFNSACDKRFITDCVEKYLQYLVTNQGTIPYRSGGDYILDVNVSRKATIALFGDWGTGTAAAVELMKQIGRKKPNVAIHLGDVYYSGTKSEIQMSFLDICKPILGDIPLFSLAGNHDMYSGGTGYYSLVDQLHQRASYFCFRNADWQFVAMDTGYNDSVPFTAFSNVTSVTPTEAEWLTTQIKDGASKDLRTCLLSHHQPFSAFEPIGGGYVNEKLLAQFDEVLDDIDIWLWGHEHRLDIYGPFRRVKRGRCLGCSAVPVFVDDGYFTPKDPSIPLLLDTTHGNKPVMLGKDGSIYNLAYAIMTLNGKKARIDYYESSDEAKPLFTERIE